MKRGLLALVVAVGLLLPTPGGAATPTSVYFAEGTTRDGFVGTFRLFNPTEDIADVDLEVDFADGAPAQHSPLHLCGHCTAGVFADDLAGDNRDFSLVVRSTTSIAVTRRISMAKDIGGAGVVSGGTAFAGVRAPAMEWDLAEGSTLPGFQEYITIQNPDDRPAIVTIGYGLEAGPGRITSLTVAPHSRATVDVNAPEQVGVGETGVSARVTATLPVLVERPFYFSRDVAGTGDPVDGAHVAAGTLPSNSWFFAEGTLLSGWSEYLTLFNPDTADAVVTVQYLLEDAPAITKTYSVAAGARRTIDVASGATDQGIGRDATSAPSKGVALQVLSTGAAIVAERPLYVRAPVKGAGIDDGHDAIGATAAVTCAAFADSLTRSPDSSWLTLANPFDTPVNLVLLPGGTASGARQLTIAGDSRVTLDLADQLGSSSAFVLMTQGSGAFVAEEPIYNAFRPDDGDAAVVQSSPC